MAKVRVTATVVFETTIEEGPEHTVSYEGAQTLAERVAREVEYLEGGGAYLMEAMEFMPHTVTATVEVLKEKA